MIMRELRSCLAVFAMLAILTGVAYPALIWSAAQSLFPWRAGGSLLRHGDKIIGSALIGLPQAGPGYFYLRPSNMAFSGDIAVSGASNLQYGHGALGASLIDRAGAWRQEHNSHNIPLEMLSASASGLDPHISFVSAELQSRRIAEYRGVDQDTIKRLIDKHSSQRILGGRIVNAAALNFELDKMNETDD